MKQKSIARAQELFHVLTKMALIKMENNFTSTRVKYK